MTLQQLVKLTDKDQIISEMLQMFPECLPNKLEFEKVIDFILATPTVAFEDFQIHIALVNTFDSEEYEEDIDEDPYFETSGYAQAEDQYLDIGFARWEEWSNAEVLIEENIHLTNEMLISICLYEMTIHGYDQDSIAKAFNAFERELTTEIVH